MKINTFQEYLLNYIKHLLYKLIKGFIEILSITISAHQKVFSLLIFL